MDAIKGVGKTASGAGNSLASGYKARNDIVDEAAAVIGHDASASVHLPWSGRVGAEAKTLLMLAQRYGAFGVTSKGNGAGARYKFYYSRASTGNWFAEVWPLWKVSAWMVLLAFLGFCFFGMKSGAGCFGVGAMLLLMFGPRAIMGYRNSVIAGRLSSYSYARESYPLMLAGAVGGVVLLEWAYVLPWNIAKVSELFGGMAGLLAMPYGIGDFVYRIAKSMFTVGAFAVGSVLAYQVTASSVMHSWLMTAFRDRIVFVEPEPGTWFHKLRTVGSNRSSGYFTLGFIVLAACALAVPLLK